MSPGGTGLQTALSHLLTDVELRAALRETPEEIRRQFSLSIGELSALRAIDADRLDLTAHAGEAKRVEFLRRGMPLTLAAIERTSGATVLRQHLDGGWSVAGPVLTSRVLGEARELARVLARTRPTVSPEWIQDLAAYELACVELRASREAGSDARRAGQASTPEGRLVLGRHVRLLELGYDVTPVASGRTQTPPPKATMLALVKAATSPRVEVFRLGASVITLLRAFTFPRDPVEVMAKTATANRGRARATVKEASAAGLLLVAA